MATGKAPRQKVVGKRTRVIAVTSGVRHFAFGALPFEFSGIRASLPDRPLPAARLALLAAFCLLGPACMVGPNYKRPPAPAPPAYKELPPANSPQASEWAPAQPSDALARGKWWEIYNDQELNALEEQVSISNQNLKVAEAQYQEAKLNVRIARSYLYPTITASPAIVNSRSAFSNSGNANFVPASQTSYTLPLSVSYEADLWGSIRRTFQAIAEAAQISDAQLENARLLYQAELAQDYFDLRGTDGEKELLQATVQSYQDYLKLTQERFQSGVASGSDVAQAQTQLNTARAQLIDYDVARAQFEHAIAVLTGKAPAELSVSSRPIHITPPPLPVGLPSTLLERRPDIAAAERQMAAANEQIGIAKAAYYPTISFSASGGLESVAFLKWIGWPSRFWSIGAQASETVFDAGRRRATVNQDVAAYDATVANYRQTVLTAFQQVEDNLAALRVLEDEAQAEDDAVQAAQNALDISTYQYKAGTVNYLAVITEQAILLQDQVQALNILTRRMSASVLLVEALGGGWDYSKLPTASALKSGK
ncbi:MAG TPA: efflux transporter outer membrane subunit [Terriglobia bacterium]|nr:efflux transporter outer membrane subunit [Terriglobia bacterium]